MIAFFRMRIEFPGSSAQMDVHCGLCAELMRRRAEAAQAAYLDDIEVYEGFEGDEALSNSDVDCVLIRRWFPRSLFR